MTIVIWRLLPAWHSILPAIEGAPAWPVRLVDSVMHVECYAATRTQQGRTQNEDAFLIGHGERPFAALCDGAGNAERAAKRALVLFEKLLREATPAELTDHAAWAKWVKLLDSSLMGGAQSTFLGVAVAGDLAVGTCVGDSRAYLVDRNGVCRILTEGARKQRLGSGDAEAFSFRLMLRSRDTLLLLSDGAWTPINLHLLQKTVVSASVHHFSEVPGAVLDAAGRHGCADDMTALALRVTQ